MENDQDNPLREKIKEAEKAEGYFIRITVKNGDRLTHTYFTNKFLKNDIMPSLDEMSKLVEQEIAR